MHLKEHELDSILYGQKDSIYELFNKSVHSPDGVEVLEYFAVSIRRITTIIQMLVFNQRLWNEAGYGYKGQEIVRRIEVACRNTRDTLHHAAHAKREQLDQIIQQCGTLDSFYCNIRGNEPRNTGTPPSVVEQVCGLGGGIDNGPICHDDRPAHNSLAAQIAAVENNCQPYN